MAKPKKMTEAELATAVNGYIDDAKTYGSTERDRDREWALKFYRGEVDFGPTGQSKVVSKDISDVHGMIMPGLKRIFFATDRMAIFEPTRPQKVMETVQGPDGQPVQVERDISEDRADQASDLINYIVLKECDGYRNISNAISDGLLIGNGIVKHWWDDTPEYQTDTYSGLDELQRNMVLSDPHLEEIIEEETYPDPDYVEPEMPQPDPQMLMAAEMGDPMALEALTAMLTPPPVPMLHRLKVKRMLNNGRVRLMAMPNEEFIIDRSAIALDESCRFAAHKMRKMRTELVAEGYDRTIVDELPSYDITEESPERDVRDRNDWTTDYSADKSTEYVEVYECYVLADYDGDGIAERRRVVIAGAANKRNVLLNDEWGDDLPFSDIVPDPQPHAWRGRGLYEKAGDIQRIKTVLLRGVLDNTYQQLAPQTEIEENSYVNMDELYNPTPHGVLIRKAGKQPKVPTQIPYIGDKIMPMSEYFDSVMEKRIGASQRSQALDMDALQNQSATAVNAATSAAFSQIEDYARNIAECGGLSRIFRCLYRLVVTHQDRAKTIRLRGEWVEIDPSSWATDMDVTVNVGLGTGSRDRDLAMLGNIAMKQEQAMAALGGPTNPILSVADIFSTYQKMCEAAGLRNPESFFPSIGEEELTKMREAASQQQQGPDPAMLKAQADAEAKRMETEANLSLKAQEQQAQQQIDQQKAIFERDLKRQEAADRLQMMREEAALKAQLRREEMQLEAELTNQANMVKMAQGVQVQPDVNINGAMG
jgi:hypothetical protein